MGNWNQWSDEATEQLKALWKTGLTASTIALRLPVAHLTRNAVLGKVHRLNLERRRPAWGGHIAQTREERNAKARVARVVRRLAAKQLMNGHSPSRAYCNHVTHKLPKAIQVPRSNAPTPSLAPLNGKARHMRPRLWKTRHAPPVAQPNDTPVSILEVTGCKFAVKSDGREHLFCNAPSDGSWCEYHHAVVYYHG